MAFDDDVFVFDSSLLLEASVHTDEASVIPHIRLRFAHGVNKWKTMGKGMVF